jgi:acyl-CoA dehydrogenase
MSNYVAPLADIWLVLRDLAEIEEIIRLPGLEAGGTDTIASMLTEAAKFADEVLEPLNRSGDMEGAEWKNGQVRMPAGFRAAYEAFAANGWASLGCEPEFGGMAAPRVVVAAVREIWHSANMAFSLGPVLSADATEVLSLCASAEIKHRFLPRMVSGEWTGTMNLTEPQAGSDLAAIRTRAELQADGTYRITGQKIFITYGEHDMAANIVHLVLARLPDAPAGTKGISMFVVPKFLVNADGTLGVRNDVTCTSIEHKLGIHASPTCVMSFGEHGGATGYLVGEANRGLEYMFILMNEARLVAGIQGLAVAERAYQQARAYASERVQGRDIAGSKTPVRILQHPDVRRMLMTMKCQIEAMRALAYFVAAAHDRADRHPDPKVRERNAAVVGLLTPVVKGWCAETGIEVASTGIQIHGGTGYVEETGAAQYLRDVRITAIYEGTTGIQANDLMSRKIAHEGGAMLGLIEEVRATARRMLEAGDEDLIAIAAPLQKGVSALDTAVAHVLENFNADPRRTAVGAVPLLKLSALVVGGWLMARAAETATQRLRNGSPDSAALDAKRATARFFADHLLSQAPGLAHTVINGAGRLMELTDAQW